MGDSGRQDAVAAVLPDRPIVGQLPDRTSFSQISSYAQCGERFRLEKVWGVRGHTWWATLGGSAVHKVTEMADRKLYGEDVEVPTFAEALEEEVQRNGSLPIHPSGRVAKSVTDWGGPSKKDKEWWLQQGPLMVERWAALRESQGWDICMMPDGKLGVEWGFEIPIGGTTLRGYIDRIVQDSQGRVLVVDLKAGSNEPSGGDLQFKTYGVALSRVFGIQADAGWFAKVGHSDPEKQLGGPHFLASGDEQYLEPVIQMWRKGVGNGVFIPNVTALCKGCTVREHCKAMNGVMARKHPYVDIEFKPPSFFAHVSSLVDQEEDAE